MEAATAILGEVQFIDRPAPITTCDGFPDVPLPYEWAEKIVNRIIRNKRGMLSAFPHLRTDNGDDVKLELLEAVNEAWKGFSLSKVASTFVGTVAGRTMIDIFRKAKRKRKHEQVYFRRRGESYDPTKEEDAEPTQTLEEWLALICLEFRRTYPRQLWAGAGVRGAGKDKGNQIAGYSTDQLAGLLALQLRLKLKPYGVYAMLRDFPELRRALRIRKTPPVKSVYRLIERAEREVAKCRKMPVNREEDSSN